MSQGILPFTVALSKAWEMVTGRAGLPLVLETMRALGLDRKIQEAVKVRERQSGYSEVKKLESLVLLMASGGERVEDIRVLQADVGLCRLLGGEFPSPDALRAFLYTFNDPGLIEKAMDERPKDTVAYIPAENAALQGLEQVNVALMHEVVRRGGGHKATLDHDATIQESHKRDALPHYKGGRGYQPAAVYWVEQDLVVADEYRDGNVPAGMSNLPLIKRSFGSLPDTVNEYYFRADSACYDERVLKWLSNAEREGGPSGPIGFTISADMSPELREICKAVPEPQWDLLEERADETVMCSEVEFTPGDWSKAASPLRYLALRIRKKQGQLFSAGYKVKYLAVVTNREGKIAELIRWHWEKAGTIEHLHDVTKNELAAGIPPCGRFGANAAWYRLSMLTYNVLSALKSLALPSCFGSARPKRLRFMVFNVAGRIVSHAARLTVRVGAKAEKIADLIAARIRLAKLEPIASTG